MRLRRIDGPTILIAMAVVLTLYGMWIEHMGR